MTNKHVIETVIIYHGNKQQRSMLLKRSSGNAYFVFLKQKNVFHHLLQYSSSSKKNSRDFLKNIHKTNNVKQQKNMGNKKKSGSSSGIRQRFEDFNEGIVSGTGGNAVDQIAERKMQAWLNSDDSKSLKKGKKLKLDYHKQASIVLGLDATTAQMTKVMVENKVLPLSVQRKKDIQHEWDNEIKIKILDEFQTLENEHPNMKNKEKLFQLFIFKKEISKKYKKDFDRLNKRVKKANDSAISDALLLTKSGGMALPPIKRFDYEARMREAIFGKVNDKIHNEKIVGKYYKDPKTGHLRKYVGKNWKNPGGHIITDES